MFSGPYDVADVFGSLAVLIGFIVQLPQIYTIYKNKSTKNINIYTYKLTWIVCVFWTIYAYLKKSYIGTNRPRFVLSYYIKLKNIPFSHIYKEFNVYLIDQYKIRKIKNTIFYFERYSNQIKILNKIVRKINCKKRT